VVVVLLGGILVAVGLTTVRGIAAQGDLFIDYDFYRELGVRFLANGTFYLPHQIQGPYDVTLMRDVLYPPSALPLFVVAALAPPPLWWAVPVGVLAYAVYLWRPEPWGVAAMLLLLCWPRAHAAFAFGNTDMWGMAAVAGGLLWGWPAVLLLLKPTFAPFAIIGVRRRAWWIALLVLAGVSLWFLPMWFDYFRVIDNLNASADYSVGSLPLLVVPVVAWLARRRSTDDEGDGPKPLDRPSSSTPIGV
jgi:hypothetical protein